MIQLAQPAPIRATILTVTMLESLAQLLMLRTPNVVFTYGSTELIVNEIHPTRQSNVYRAYLDSESPRGFDDETLFGYEIVEP